MKRFLGFFLLIVIVLLAVFLFNAFRFESKQVAVEEIEEMAVDDSAVERLCESIRIPTISPSPYIPDTVQLKKFTAFLDSSYQQVTSKLEKTMLAEFTPLYKWKGKDASKKPIMLIAHYDVVPVENEAGWDQPPFSGKIDNGFIYGRGSLDDKLSVLGILESVEALLAQGFQPQQDIYLGFGHDEETTGTGAKAMAQYLKENNIQVSMLLDEGSIVGDDVFPGLAGKVGLIGIAEKGYATAKITAKADGGHSSMPPKETAVGILAKAVLEIQNNPMPQRSGGVMQDMFDYVGPEMGLMHRVIFSNMWFFGPIVRKQLANNPGTNASTRTTGAPTMLKGSIKDNVLPQSAEARVNFRIFPGDTPDDVLVYLKETIDDDRVSIEFMPGVAPAAPIASHTSVAFEKLALTTRQIWPDVTISPSLCVATTDSRHLVDVADDIYRFLPVVADHSDISRIHGSNERISVEGYKDVIRFYTQLIRNYNQ